jgi:signal transduction histidine kinase
LARVAERLKGLDLGSKAGIVALRGLIALILLFFLLYNPEFETSLRSTPFLLVASYVASVLAMAKAPSHVFARPRTASAVFLFDIVMISLIMYSSAGFDSDLYLIYFLVIFMNGMQMRAGESFLIGTVASLVYLFVGTRSGSGELMTPNILLRIPFFYIVSFFTAHFAQEAKKSAQEKSEQATLLDLYDSVRAIFGQVEMRALLPLANYVLRRKLQADGVVLLLGGTGLEQASVSGLEDGPRLQTLLILAEDQAPAALEKGELSVLEDGCTLLMPLVKGRNPLGTVLVTRRKGRPFSDRDKRYAMILSTELSQALLNARLYQELEQKITEVQKVQGQLVQSEKMAALGRVSGGLAHELRNPLSGVLANAQFLARDLEKLEGGKPLQGMVEEIASSAKRCAGIITSLLSFSRHSNEEVKLEPLDEILGKALAIVEPRYADGKVAVERPNTDGIRVLCSRIQIEQVFTNLLANALEATPAGGKVRVKASSVATHAHGKGPWALVEVSDTGSGITAANLDKIFEPFFTTKPPGKGVGLGLSFCYEIVRRHGGHLWVRSAGENRGATFFVLLPREADHG